MKDNNHKEPIIGRVAATKMQGNNSREFFFWIDPDTRINPLDLIVVQEKLLLDGQDGRKVYGQVLDITSYTDAESFLEIFASTDFGNVQLTSDVDRVAFSVGKAQVLRTSDDIRMPVQFGSPVYLADEEAILVMLRADEVKKEDRLPIGYIEQSNKIKVPVYMEASWLTGPDGAHLNVSGKSRLAAKTSYTLFLISSILQTQKDTAVVIFNVKGSDLLQIHEPNYLIAAGNQKSGLNRLNDTERQLFEELKDSWESMELKAKPFDKEKVFYFLPSQKNDSTQVNTDLRNLPVSDVKDITKQPNNYFIYRYTLQNVRGKLRLLLANQNITDPQEQLINALNNDTKSYAWTDSTFENFSKNLNNCVDKNTKYLSASSDTVRVVKRILDNVTNNRTTGVFDYQRPSFASNRVKLPSDFIKGSLEAGQVLVVDIGSVNDIEKQWVFGDVLRSVEEKMASGDSRTLKKVIVFVDELNKYAPSGSSSPLVNNIIDITARGGSLGVILFGAEQFASRINPQVYGNCANKAFGLTDATEASTDPYRSFPKEIKDRLSELQRGELILNFDFFGQPLRIKFPPPACRKQEDANSALMKRQDKDKIERTKIEITTPVEIDDEDDIGF